MKSLAGDSTRLDAARDLPTPPHPNTRAAVPGALDGTAVTLKYTSLTAGCGQAVGQGLADAQGAKSVGTAVRERDAIHLPAGVAFRTGVQLLYTGVTDVLPTQPREADREPGPGSLPPERELLRPVPLMAGGDGGFETTYTSVEHYVSQQTHVREETLRQNPSGREHALIHGGATMGAIHVVPATFIVAAHTQMVADGDDLVQVQVMEQRGATTVTLDGITRDSKRLVEATADGRQSRRPSVGDAVEQSAVVKVTVPVVQVAAGIYQQVVQGEKWDRKVQVRQIAGPELRQKRASERLSSVRREVARMGVDGERFVVEGRNAALLLQAGAQVVPAHIFVGYRIDPDAAGSETVLLQQTVQSMHSQMPHRESARLASQYKNLVDSLPDGEISDRQRSLLKGGRYAVDADGCQVEFFDGAQREWPNLSRGEAKIQVASLPAWVTTRAEFTDLLRTTTGVRRVTGQRRAELAAQASERMLRGDTSRWDRRSSRPPSEAAAKQLGRTFSAVTLSGWQVTGRSVDGLLAAALAELGGDWTPTTRFAGRPATAELVVRSVVVLTVSGVVRTGGSARVASLADVRKHGSWGVGEGDSAVVPVDLSPDQIFSQLSDTSHGLEALSIWTRQFAAALNSQAHPGETMRALRLVDGEVQVTADPLTPARLVCFADPEAVATREAEALGEWPEDEAGGHPSGSPERKKLCRELNAALCGLEALAKHTRDAVGLLQDHPHLVDGTDVVLRVRALMESWQEQQMPVSGQLFALDQLCPPSTDAVCVQLDVVDDEDAEDVA